MKIAYINDQLFPCQDTDTEQIMAMVSGLAQAGADLDLWLPKAWGRPAPTVQELSSYYHVPPNFSVKTVRSAFPSTRALEKPAHALAMAMQPELRRAQVAYTRTLPMVAALLASSRMPVVYETFRPWPDQKPALKPMLSWMVKHPRFLLAVTHSQLAGDSFLRIGLPPQRLLAIHNGYDPQRVQPTLTKAEARTRLNLPPDRPVLVYAGHVNLKKGCGMLLDMVAALPKAFLVLVGSQTNGEVEQRAAKMENVRVVPWQSFPETVPYLYAADVLMVPPTLGPLETVGNTVLPIKTFLYMACGRPIFAADTPDLREVLVDGQNAVLVPPDRLDLAVARLQALLDDAPLLQRLGERARQDVAPNTWLSRARRVNEVISKNLTDFGPFKK